MIKEQLKNLKTNHRFKEGDCNSYTWQICIQNKQRNSKIINKNTNHPTRENDQGTEFKNWVDNKLMNFITSLVMRKMQIKIINTSFKPSCWQY